MLNKAELAAEWGVSVRTIERWRSKGLPVAEEAGPHGGHQYDEGTVRAWLAAQGILPGARGAQGGRARAEQGRRRAEREQKGAADVEQTAASAATEQLLFAQGIITEMHHGEAFEVTPELISAWLEGDGVPSDVFIYDNGEVSTSDTGIEKALSDAGFKRCRGSITFWRHPELPDEPGDEE